MPTQILTIGEQLGNNNTIESVADPYLRGRFAIMQELVLKLDDLAREKRAELTDLSRPPEDRKQSHEERLHNVIHRTMLENELKGIVESTEQVISVFNAEADAYNEKLKSEPPPVTIDAGDDQPVSDQVE